MGRTPRVVYAYEHLGKDILSTLSEETIGTRGMKVDRMLFERFGNTVRGDETLKEGCNDQPVGPRYRLRKPRDL